MSEPMPEVQRFDKVRPVDRSNRKNRAVAEAMNRFTNGPDSVNEYAVDHWQRMYEDAVLPAQAALEAQA